MKNLIVKLVVVALVTVAIMPALGIGNNNSAYAASNQATISQYQQGWNQADNDIYSFVRKSCMSSYRVYVSGGYNDIGPTYSCNNATDYSYGRGNSWHNGYYDRYSKLVNYLDYAGCMDKFSHFRISRDRNGTHVTCV